MRDTGGEQRDVPLMRPALIGSWLLMYVGLLYLTYHTMTTAPTGFIPEQDQGYLLVNVQLPDSASRERNVPSQRS
jgi:multidrug efflux pump subunit AcrB